MDDYAGCSWFEEDRCQPIVYVDVERRSGRGGRHKTIVGESRRSPLQQL